MSETSGPGVYIMAAMCKNRGIAKDGHLPWSPISKDYAYYTKTTSHREDPGKKVVRIKGRITWEDTGVEEKTTPGCINIVVSNTLSDCPEHVHFLANNVNEAIELATASHWSQQVEKVWVMGGQNIYEDALKHPIVKRVYLTHICHNHDADRFFPVFEDKFKVVSDPDVDHSQQEENGVKFQFQVYERFTS